MKQKIKNVLILLAVTAFFSACGNESDNPVAAGDDNNPGTPAKWSVETIVSNGSYPSLALDSEGNPHISFLDYSDGYVKYAYRKDDVWTVVKAGNTSNGNGTFANGGISAIALDASGVPNIVYYDYGNVQFKYLKKNGSSWNSTVISLPDDPKMSYSSPFIPWAESSIIIDQQTGTAHVSIQMLGGLSGFVLGYWRTGWSKAVIVDGDDTNNGYNNSIGVDASGNVGISYESRSAGELKYAYWTGAGFTKESIAAMPNIYWMEKLTDLKIDKTGTPHIVFYGDGGYKYAVRNGSGWTIIGLTYQSGYPSLALGLDGNNIPHAALSTIDYGNSYRLKNANLSGSQWSFETVEDNIYHCTICIDSSGKKHIVYEVDGGILKYAYK